MTSAACPWRSRATRCFAGLALILSAPAAWAAPYSVEVRSDSPIAYYRFEESFGAVTALDSSEHENHGTYAGMVAPTLEVAGLTGEGGTAAEFSGNQIDSARVDVPPLFDPAATSWTIEAIFRTDGVGTVQTILQQVDGGGTERSLMQIGADGEITGFLGGAARRSDFFVTAEEPVHAAFVFERTGGNGSGEGLGSWTWYVNGVATASGHFAGDDGIESSSGGFLIGIGSQLDNQLFDGVIDEVAIYTSALPAERIAAHTEAIATPPLVISFSASPARIPNGGTATLSWTVSPEVTSLSIEPGPGDVMAATSVGGGSAGVSPSAGTTYTLSASDGITIQTAEASVAVGDGGNFRINEFLAINAGPIVDEDNEEEDWIEILNPGAAVEDLGGWYLTDDPGDLTQWRFPETLVPAGGYLLVFASGKDRAVAGSELHTNFKLDGDGEFLALVRPDGITIQHQFTPEFPAQVAAVSYGFVPGGGSVGYFNNPTPLAENDAAAVAAFIAEPVVADVTRGFFESSFAVTLSTEAEGAAIYYTMDASEPSPTHGTLYTEPIPVTTTTTLRAGAFRVNQAPLRIMTQSYIFLSHVLRQPASPRGYPTVWQPSVTADYAMDRSPEIGTLNEIVAALRALPTISLVMPIDDWFNNSTDSAVGGIYSNSTIARGPAWERKVSAEFFGFPHGQEIQADAGMRIFGNASRQTSRPKHNMRIVFRRNYGPSKLEFPIFGDDAEPESINSLLLRGQNGDSWVHPSSVQRQEALYIRDQLARSLQAEMGQPATRQSHAHVYINGLYWGVFNTIERIEDDSMVEEFGGNELDWDVIKSSRNAGMEVVDGSIDSWNTVVNLAASGVTSPGAYAALQEYLDFDNMIDWLLVNFYNGNSDWDDNNWQAGRLRAPGETFKFFVWDSERTLLSTGANSTTKNFSGRVTGVHHALRANPEYRLHFADRVHRHFFTDGALTPARVAAIFNGWADFLRVPLVAESARWGDTHRSGNPYTVSNEWQSHVNYQNSTYIPGRTATVLGQLRAQDLYPDVAAPVFNRHGGEVAAGFELAMSAAAGTIYYTLDGSDPRVPASVGDRFVFLTAGAPATAHVPADDSLGDSWQQAGFNDAGWTAGVTGIGYETAPEDYQSLFGLDMIAANTVNASVYARVPFTIATQAELDAIGLLVLNMKYDDGFVAYLNGVRVAARNDPSPLEWNSEATTGHPDASAIVYDSFTIDAAGIEALRVGTNVLAIHLLNNGAGSSDLLAVPQLVGASSGTSGISRAAREYTGPIVLSGPAQPRARVLHNGEWSALTTAPFYVDAIPAGPDNLAISEIHYHPASDDNGEEYIELMNIGDRPIDLRGVRFTDGIEFEFIETAQYELAALAPGQRVTIVGRPLEFEALHGVLRDGVAGKFRGNLENDGERIVLAAADGSTIRDFTYNDKHPWPESADGDGYSLVLIAPLSNPAHGDPLNWRSSVAVHGSPNASDAETFTGDAGADADRDGLTAFFEHGTGTSDFDPGSGSDAFEISSLAGRVMITLRQNLAADDAILELESSANLVDWSPAAAAVGPLSRTNNGDGTATLVYEIRAPLAGRLFLRARVAAR